MNIAVICFTPSGYEIMKKIEKLSGMGKGRLSGYDFLCFCKCSTLKEKCDACYVKQPVEEWTKEQFLRKRALLFIGAAGIAVRAIAPSVENKLTDSPVLVMDDSGQFVIPILSGHVGGANEIAETLASVMEATPVITTATDVHHLFAVDVFAKRNHLHIVNKAGIAKVSAKVLAGEKIRMRIISRENVDWKSYEAFRRKHPQETELVFEERDFADMQEMEIVFGKEDFTHPQAVDVWIGDDCGNALLQLRPKEYIIGIGCKKGKCMEEIRAFAMECLKKKGIMLEQVYSIASIERKKEEEGIVAFARNAQIPFQTFSAEELLAQQGDFRESDFVRNQVGVGNVCERAALAACKRDGEVILHKQAQDGITIAIAKRKWSVRFDEA